MAYRRLTSPLGPNQAAGPDPLLQGQQRGSLHQQQPAPVGSIESTTINCSNLTKVILEAEHWCRAKNPWLPDD